jgi:hypothetical protein
MSNWWRGLRDRARCRLDGRHDFFPGLGIIYQPTFVVADDLREGSLIALALDQPMQELDGVYGVSAGTPSHREGAGVHRFSR